MQSTRLDTSYDPAERINQTKSIRGLTIALTVSSELGVRVKLIWNRPSRFDGRHFCQMESGVLHIVEGAEAVRSSHDLAQALMPATSPTAH